MLTLEQRDILEELAQEKRIHANTILIGDNYPQEQARKWAHHSERQVRAIEAALKADDELAIAHYDTMAREKISNLLNTRGNTP